VVKLHRQFSKEPLLEVASDPATGIAEVRFKELMGGTLKRRVRQLRLPVEVASVFVEKNLDFFLRASGQQFAYLQVTDYLRSLGLPHYSVENRTNSADVAPPPERDDEGETEGGSHGDDREDNNGKSEVDEQGKEEAAEPISSAEVEDAVVRTGHQQVRREQLAEHANRIMSAVTEIVFTGPFAGAGIDSRRSIAVLTAGLRGAEALPRPIAVKLKRLVSGLKCLTGGTVDLRVAEGYLELIDHTGTRVLVRTFNPDQIKTPIHPADLAGYAAQLDAADWPLFHSATAKRVVDGLGRVDAKDKDPVQFRRDQDGIKVSGGDPELLTAEFAVRGPGGDAASIHLPAKSVKAVFGHVANDSSGAIAFLKIGLGVRVRDGGAVSYLIAPFDPETGRSMRLPQIGLLEAAVPIGQQYAVDTKSGKRVYSQTIQAELKKEGFDVTSEELGTALRDVGAGPTTFTAPGMKSARGPKLEQLEAALVRVGVAPGGRWVHGSGDVVRHEYVPAIGPYVTDPGPWRHPIHWLDPSTPVFYPRVMASYPLWLDTSLPVSREEATIVGDSGGYEVVTQGLSLDPEEVIRWQLKNCSRGMILDIPPYSPGAAIQLRGSAGEAWADSLEQTVRNVQRALPHYQQNSGPFKWWGVVQGQTREQITEWYDNIAKVYPFTSEGEGWALAPKPSTDLLFCARYLRFAYAKRIRRVHVLQISGAKTVGVVLGLAALSGNFELVSYDTATAMRSAINRCAVIHDGLGMAYISENTREGETTVTDYMSTCPCQACVWSREDYPLTNREVPHYLLLHNHLVLSEACERIYREALRDPDGLVRWAADELYSDVMREWEGGRDI
jgi:hypothetical protein